MNIQQFEYVLALADTRHFETAADRCHITQSTLSTMISKLEEELGILIFDRKKKPLEITSEGVQLITQIQIISKEIGNLDEIVKEIKGEIKGEISISVIPTIAPYLIPLFITQFAAKYPQLRIQVKEEQTAEIIRNLKQRTLDIGIVSIPIKDKDLLEFPLYNEPFVYFDMASQVSNSQSISAKEVDLSRLCLLEEGHCMRAQVLELCDFHEKHWNRHFNFKYNAGSIDSLLRFVKHNDAATLLPYLAAQNTSHDEESKIRFFKEPVPYRSVGLLTHKHFVKKGILDKLKSEIMDAISTEIPEFNVENSPLQPL
jgi:LysR family hydrogen peroxide-inducible transcriptional activator